MSGPILHGGGVTEAAARFGGRPDEWLDLSTGINPNPVPLPDIPVSAWHRLPDRHLLDEARQAAAVYYGCGGTRPLPVPGTQSAIQLLPRLAPPRRRVVVVGPTYGEYARVMGLNGFEVDFVADIDGVAGDAGLAIVVNPNNPTGAVYAAADLLALADRMGKGGGILLVDEAFGDAMPAESVAAHVKGREDLVVFRSFGKFFGLAGLRLGFVIACDAIQSRFGEWLGPWAVSGPALSVAADLMRGDTFTIRNTIASRKSALDAVLGHAGLDIVGGTPLFTLVDHRQAALLHERLCTFRILTRKFDYAQTWLRIGLAPDAAADARLADALTRALS